ncbi:DUF2510 domain-containing protein [Rhodococcus sp. O3]|uniref:DUF2510 domain-containing protein n=1 Tax=Rhodococcus sp. O3 TaxID=3404919 RepID=UPI003B67837C
MSPWHFLVLFAILAAAVAAVAGIVIVIVKASKSKVPPAVHNAIPAGWYTDPQNPTMVRYYDGGMWTAHTQPRAHTPHS